MPSSIDSTKPVSGNPTTLSVRSNFLAAKTEINELQRTTEDYATAAGTVNVMTADFTNDVTLADGVQIVVKAVGANTSTTPTIDVDGTGAKTIVKNSGEALLVGDIAGSRHYMQLQYDSTNTVWVLLNPKHVYTEPYSPPTASTTTSGEVELATSAETITGTDAARAVTPAGLQAKVASTSAKGIVELATGAETLAQTDGTRAVTPLGLASLLGAEGVAGLIEVATQAQTEAGTSDATAVTPLKLLAGQGDTLVASAGHFTFPDWLGGFMIQWATTTTAGAHSWATPFPTACLAAVASQQVVGSSATNTHIGCAFTTTQYTLTFGADVGGNITVIAVGY